MATASDIIDRAYSLLGVKSAGDALAAADVIYALGALNSMLDSWNTQNLFILSHAETVAVVTGQTATIGPGMVFNTARPVAIRAGAYARYLGVDYPLMPLEFDQYSLLPNKSQPGLYPKSFYYQSSAVTGLIYFYPVPAGSEIHLPINAYLTAFADLSTNYALAPGYQRAIEYSLVEELAPGIRPLDPNIARIAQNARKAIRKSNISVPVLGVDASIPNGRRPMMGNY